MSMGPPSSRLLGPKLEGTTLRAVVRWRAADPRTRSNREPWKWDEHGLALASPRRTASQQWRSARQRVEDRRKMREAGASAEGATPDDVVTADVLAQNPGVNEAQLRRAASYCGCSQRRLAAFMEEFARQDVSDASYPALPADSVVAEHCVEQEELVATGRYVREDAPARTPNRRRRKPPLVTRASSTPPSGSEEDEHEEQQAPTEAVQEDDGAEQDGSTEARVCTGLAELGATSWAGTEHSVNGGVLVLGSDGEPESYHSPKHPDRSSPVLGNSASSELLQQDEVVTLPAARDLRQALEPEPEIELESLVGVEASQEDDEEDETQDNDGIAAQADAAAADETDDHGRTSPIQAYLRMQRRPTTSDRPSHDHMQAEVAFAQIRAQLAHLKQRPHTSPQGPGAGLQSPAMAAAMWAAEETARRERAQSVDAPGPSAKDAGRGAVVPAEPASSGARGSEQRAQQLAKLRNNIGGTSGTAMPLVASFGGMPASAQGAGSRATYHRGRSGMCSPTAVTGEGGPEASSTPASASASSSNAGSLMAGGMKPLGVEPMPSSASIAFVTGLTTHAESSRGGGGGGGGNIATPPSSPLKPTPVSMKSTSIGGNSAVTGGGSCIPLAIEAVYRPLDSKTPSHDSTLRSPGQVSGTAAAGGMMMAAGGFRAVSSATTTHGAQLQSLLNRAAKSPASSHSSPEAVAATMSLPAHASWMSISAPSLPSASTAVTVDIEARVAGAYGQPGQSNRFPRAARGALSRQRRISGGAAHEAMALRRMRAVRTRTATSLG